jgi:3',5'-cyclic-AMP phosphodiesterase
LARPFLLAQLSDPHLGEPKMAGVKPKACLKAVVGALERLPNPPDTILVTGDLAEDATPKQYALARRLIGRLGVPIHVLPGNHDDRATMRAAFGLPGEGSDPIDYTVDLGPLRLIVVDSTIPGEDHGNFEPAQLERLDRELAAAADQPTIVAMHHSPLATAIPDWDGVNLPEPERRALAAVIERHPQVRAIVGGHLHRIAASTLAGVPVLAAPSTFLQARPDFVAETVKLGGKPPGFVLHALRDGELSSQVQMVPLDRP